MSTTPELIDNLVETAHPVRRLPPPWLRACTWLALAGLVVALLAALHGLRADIWQRLHDPAFVLSLGSSLATGALAALAAFMISLPDRAPGWALLPLPAVAVWATTIGYGCFAEWVSVGPYGMQWGETARCFATLALTSAPLGIALVAMLRYAALLRGASVALAAGLAVAGISASALSLLHPLDATIMILAWNGGIVVLMVALGGFFGPRMLRWAASGLTTAPPGPSQTSMRNS